MIGKLTKAIELKTIEVETDEDVVQLQMSLVDAVILSRIFDQIGGPPEGYRGAAERISGQLYIVLKEYNIHGFDTDIVDEKYSDAGSLYLKGNTKDVTDLEMDVVRAIKK